MAEGRKNVPDSGVAPAILTKGLTKYYRRVLGIQELDLEVHQGELFGFLGPNGAGKSTTIQLLMGFLRPTEGSARVLGSDPWTEGTRVRAEIGFVPDAPALYENLTGRQVLDYLGRLQNKPSSRRGEVLERLQLQERDLARPVRGYSRGMRQKLALTQALQHDPRLLVLDEPTEGLDPLMQQAVFGLLRDLRADGRTIFMSSHILSDVERLCDRVGIVRAGRLVALEGVEALRRRQIRHMQVTLKPAASDPADIVLDSFAGVPGVLSIERNGTAWHLKVQGEAGPILQVLARLPVEDLVYEPAHLEDAFLEFYGAAVKGQTLHGKPD